MLLRGYRHVMAYHLDAVDHALLDRLQENARYTAVELAEDVGVSDNTVHNRIARLEDAGVITGYAATVGLEAAGFGLHFHFTCTASVSERAAVAEEALALPQVVEVVELMTGRRNLHVKAVGVEDRDITRVAERLDQLALEIDDENLVRAEHASAVDFAALSGLLGGARE